MFDNLRTDRLEFLKYVGATLLAGLGMVLFPNAAQAAINCCPASCKNCSGSARAFRCNCPGSSYCVCKDRSTCYSGPC